MPVNMTIHTTDASSPQALSPTEKRNDSPLIEQIHSANTSSIAFARNNTSWLPERMLEWLKNQLRHTPRQRSAEDSEKAQPLMQKLPLRQAMNDPANAGDHCEGERRNCLAWKMGLLMLGISASAFGAYAWLRLKNDGERSANKTDLLPGSVTLPVEDYPLFQALIASTTMAQSSTEKSADNQASAPKPPFRLRKKAVLCEGAAALERCENLRAQHLPQKPGILMIKNNNQTCRCPVAGVAVKSNVLFNEIEKTPPEQQLPAGIKIKDAPSEYFRDKATHNLSTEPPAVRRDKKSYIHNTQNKDEAVTESPIDDVKIVKLFDFSCIEARNNMSTIDKIRTVANTLTKPVTNLAKEIQIIYSHNVAGKGCPDSETIEILEDITGPVDVAINNIISLFPGMRVPALLQNVVGPAMQMLVDQYEGKPVQISRFSDLNDQITSLLRPIIPTLSSTEQVSLYNKPTVKEPPSSVQPAGTAYEGIYNHRLTVHNNIPQVTLDGHHYKLQTLPNNTPFIIDNDRHFNFLRYDNLNRRWVSVAGDEANIYTEKAQEQLDKYSLFLANRAEESSFKIDKESEFLTFSTPGEPDITGVFVAGKFIPAKWEHVNGNRVAVTNTPGQAEKRVLIYNSFGWSFERPSVKKDKYLKLLLQDQNTAIPLAIKHTRANHIAPINNAIGFSDSAFYGKLIKHNNKYYRVVSTQSDITHAEQNKLMGYNDAVIEFDNGMFKLKSSDDIPFVLRTEKEIPRPNLPVSLRMEKGSLDYLTQHAKTTTTAPLYAMHNGLFNGENGEKLFVFQGRSYPVSKYEDKLITIPRHDAGNAPNIRLWRDGDTWIRIRDERNKPFTEYEEAASCRSVRAPGPSGSCSPVMIEMDLHKLLSKFIDKDMTTNHPPKPENLSKSDVIEIPVLFFDVKTLKNFLLYNNNYFDAEVIQADDKNNPTDLPCLRITGRGNIFSKKKEIATIVIHKEQDKYYIKTQKTFLAEKLNIDKKVAGAYLQNRPYRDVSEIDTIEDIVNEVQEARKIVVTKPRRNSVSTDRSLAAYAKQQESVKNILFSEHVNKNTDKYHIKLFTLDADSNLLNPFEQKAVQQIKEKLKYTKEKILNSVVAATYIDGPGWPAIRDYFRGILPNSNAQKQLEADFTASLQLRLERMFRALDEKKIVLVTAHEQTETTLTDRIDSILPPEEKLAGDAGHMSTDGEGRLFINIDKLDFDGTSANAALADPITVIMHTASHTKDMSADVIQQERNRGIMPSVNDFITQLTTQLEEQTLPPRQLNTLIEISKEYINSVAPYRRKPASLLTSKGLAYLLQNDPGYCAHVLLNSSDSITALAQDMYYWINMSNNNLSTGWIDPWIRRFGIAHGDLRDTDLKLSVSTSQLELSSLTSSPLNYLSLHEVPGKKNIYYALPDLDLLLKNGQQYYPVEFVGTSNKIIFVGKPDDVRQIYYYTPATGNIKPVQPVTRFNNAVYYNRNLDVFETVNIETGISSVLKYDEAKDVLVDTGAQQVVPMLNNVMKVEFKNFDLFTTGKNTREVYLAAHAARQLTLKRQPIPDNVNLKFYTPKGKVLRGHVDDVLELVKNTLPVKETKPGGTLTETYDINYDDDSQINYHQLTESSAKNLIRIKPDATVTSTEIMNAMSKFYANKDIDLHLYICRSC
ncbi:hypothetical protein [Vagococcus sp. WN89Y]|uniref:hypothetical protein n=1 Tax=Vagococcus sp. WN89Y TaxID=3457258 RepID=UPI003FCCD3A3